MLTQSEQSVLIYICGSLAMLFLFFKCCWPHAGVTTAAVQEEEELSGTAEIVIESLRIPIAAECGQITGPIQLAEIVYE